MTFRLIPFRRFSGAVNMGLDEAIMDAIKAGKSEPTVRFYGWDPSAVSIGYFQGLTYEVNQQVCRAEGVDVVRRITGGGAVYHDRDGEVTYSIIGPLELFPGNILESYRVICADVVTGLRSLGIQAEFKPANDILVGDRKISGNAQTRREGILLQHGTILYRVEVEKMFALLSVSEVKLSDKLIHSVKKRVAGVSEFKPVSLENLAAALQASFAESWHAIVGDYSPEELRRADELAQQKYGAPDWVGMR